MIELSGIRYAVGRRTAAAMMLSTTAVVTAYSLLFPVTIVNWFHDLPESPWYRVLSVGLWLMLMGYIGFFVIGVTLAVSDKQTVRPVPRGLATPGSWNLDLKPLLRSKPGWLPILMLGLIVFALASNSRVHILVEVVMAIVAAFHTKVCVRVTIRMCREAASRIDGRLDECRDFNWVRFGMNDEVRFRARFPDTRWKYPGLIRQRAEAARYAHKARTQRWMTTALAALFALCTLFLINQPVGEFIRNVASAVVHHPDRLDMSVWDIYRSLGLVTLLLVPIAMQQHVGNLDSLARLYDERVAQLRTARAGTSRRLASRQPSPGGTGLARNH